MDFRKNNYNEFCEYLKNLNCDEISDNEISNLVDELFSCNYNVNRNDIHIEYRDNTEDLIRLATKSFVKDEAKFKIFISCVGKSFVTKNETANTMNSVLDYVCNAKFDALKKNSNIDNFDDNFKYFLKNQIKSDSLFDCVNRNVFKYGEQNFINIKEFRDFFATELINYRKSNKIKEDSEIISEDCGENTIF